MDFLEPGVRARAGRFGFDHLRRSACREAAYAAFRGDDAMSEYTQAMSDHFTQWLAWHVRLTRANIRPFVNVENGVLWRRRKYRRYRE